MWKTVTNLITICFLSSAFFENHLVSSASSHHELTLGSTRQRRQINSQRCKLPENTRNGQWKVWGETAYKPGQLVLPDTLLQLQCDKKYKVNGATFIFCANGTWNTNLSECLPSCPPLRSTDTIMVSCIFRGSERDCSEPISHTTAKFSCAPFYELSTTNTIRYCLDGTWDETIPTCQPVCGQKAVTPKQLVVGGDVVKKGTYPWTTAIYRNDDGDFTHICGGSLISPGVVVTVAHCVADQDGKVRNADEFRVAAGKYYRSYDDKRDSDAEFAEIEKIIVYERYRGALLNFEGDIAVLVTKVPFNVTRFIQPVCIDVGNTFHDSQLDGASGVISGWGYTSPEERPSDALQELTVPHVSYSECFSHLPEAYKQFLISDKLCVGYLNRGKSVCTGDSGGGIAFLNQESKRFFLRGIVSVAPRNSNGGCDTNQYSLATRISRYMSFLTPIFQEDRRRRSTSTNPIQSETSEPKPQTKTEDTSANPGVDSGKTVDPDTRSGQRRTNHKKPSNTQSCPLPPQSPNGYWSIYANSSKNYSPGDKVVADGTVLQIICDDGFKVDGPSYLPSCNNGRWYPEVPRCAKTCPAPPTSAKLLVTCSYNKREIYCSDSIANTVALFRCAPYYELSTINSVRYCLEDGTWDDSIPTCKPVCGQKNVNVKKLIIGGQEVIRGTYPWTVAIYQLKGESFDHRCGGTLISPKVIVTAAHCVTDKKGVKYNESIYRVAAGKYYRSYDDARDTDAEFSEVESIFTYNRYMGGTFDFEYDIAVIITKKAFNLTQYIQAVCMDWDATSKYESQLVGDSGTVTGWGYTVRGANVSDSLKEISLPFVGYSECVAGTLDDFKKFITNDKICAGYLNKGVGVCEGDSGGGLTFLDPKSNRYFLRAIVSIAPQIEGSCNEDQYAFYTKVSSYIDFLLSKDRKYRVG